MVSLDIPKDVCVWRPRLGCLTCASAEHITARKGKTVNQRSDKLIELHEPTRTQAESIGSFEQFCTMIFSTFMPGIASRSNRCFVEDDMQVPSSSLLLYDSTDTLERSKEQRS